MSVARVEISGMGGAIFVAKIVKQQNNQLMESNGHESVIFHTARCRCRECLETQDLEETWVVGDPKMFEGVPLESGGDSKKFHFGKIKRMCKKSILTCYEVCNCPWVIAVGFCFIIS